MSTFIYRLALSFSLCLSPSLSLCRSLSPSLPPSSLLSLSLWIISVASLMPFYPQHFNVYILKTKTFFCTAGVQWAGKWESGLQPVMNREVWGALIVMKTIFSDFTRKKGFRWWPGRSPGQESPGALHTRGKFHFVLFFQVHGSTFHLPVIPEAPGLPGRVLRFCLCFISSNSGNLADSANFCNLHLCPGC